MRPTPECWARGPGAAAAAYDRAARKFHGDKAKLNFEEGMGPVVVLPEPGVIRARALCRVQRFLQNVAMIEQRMSLVP